MSDETRDTIRRCLGWLAAHDGLTGAGTAYARRFLEHHLAGGPEPNAPMRPEHVAEVRRRALLALDAVREIEHAREHGGDVTVTYSKPSRREPAPVVDLEERRRRR